ncbi:MAG: Holliday junction branch migration protein RuvA [Bordetella sp.]
MIAQISGLLIEKTPPSIVIDAHGIGYSLDLPMSSYFNLPELGQPVKLLTHFVVREDAQLLYGFLTQAERQAFRELIKVSGVGPRIALAVLSGLSVDQLIAAVSMQEVAGLIRVPGIGKKTAERMLLELKGRLAETLPGASLSHTSGESSALSLEVGHALQALGYSDKEIQQALRQVGPLEDLSEGIRQALKVLAR